MQDTKKRVAEYQTDDELMKGLREKEIYIDLDARLNDLVRTEDLISRIETDKMAHLLTILDTEEKRREFCDELQFQLTNTFIQKIVDKDRLESDEMVFLMVMIEDIARRMARDYVYGSSVTA